MFENEILRDPQGKKKSHAKCKCGTAAPNPGRPPSSKSSDWIDNGIRKKSLIHHSSEVGLGRELQLVQSQPALAFERKALLFKSRSPRERAVAPAVSELALKFGYVHMAIGVLLRTKHKLARYLTCGGCEEANTFLKMQS